MNQLQIGLDIRVKLQTSPSTQLNIRDAEKILRLEEAGGGLEPEGQASEFPVMDKMIKQHHFGILEIKKEGIDWKVFGLEGEELDRFSFVKGN